MKAQSALQNAACMGVIILAVAQVEREPPELGFPLLALGFVLLTALVFRAEPARRVVTAVGFVLCAIVSARFLLRVPLSFASETVWYVAPTTLLLCLAFALQALSRPSFRPRVSSSVPVAALACATVAAFGYLCLSQIYSLEAEVLRLLVLNCVLTVAAWTLTTGTKPRKALSSVLCAGLLLSGGMTLS